MEPHIVKVPLPADEFGTVVAEHRHGMIKVVVDIEKRVLALGGDLHADGEQRLLDDGSRQEDIWGANIYPGKPPGEQIEYTSMINIRPRQGNRSMDITEATLRDAVAGVIRSLLPLF